MHVCVCLGAGGGWGVAAQCCLYKGPDHLTFCPCQQPVLPEDHFVFDRGQRQCYLRMCWWVGALFECMLAPVSVLL